MEKEKKLNVGIYYRLNGRSCATFNGVIVEKQKQVLEEYAQQQGWNVVGCYIDEGFSGLTFHRPELARLSQDIEDGKIDVVLTSDMARIGRDLPLTLKYILEHFVNKGVRYVAFNGGIDTGRDGHGFFCCLTGTFNELRRVAANKPVEEDELSEDYEL